MSVHVHTPPPPHKMHQRAKSLFLSTHGLIQCASEVRRDGWTCCVLQYQTHCCPWGDRWQQGGRGVPSSRSFPANAISIFFLDNMPSSRKIIEEHLRQIPECWSWPVFVPEPRSYSGHELYITEVSQPVSCFQCSIKWKTTTASFPHNRIFVNQYQVVRSSTQLTRQIWPTSNLHSNWR